MSIYKDTMFILKKYNISANKSLGQNFLINEEVVENIVSSADIEENDMVIEIGPGLGTLTNELVQRAKKVVAVELDTRMIKILNDRFSLYNNFEVINEDILKINLKELIKKQKEENDIKNVKIVANLPYYITTPIIMKLLEERLDIESITVMIQKEVAERITAIPGKKQTGAITYAVYYYAEPEKVMLVPNTSFIPEPEVESEVIKLKIRNHVAVEIKDEDDFFELIKASFMQRRKTLVNGVVNYKLIEKEKFIKILNKLDIDERVRGESLSIEQFALISNEISYIKSIENNS